MEIDGAINTHSITYKSGPHKCTGRHLTTREQTRTDLARSGFITFDLVVHRAEAERGRVLTVWGVVDRSTPVSEKLSSSSVLLQGRYLRGSLPFLLGVFMPRIVPASFIQLQMHKRQGEWFSITCDGLTFVVRSFSLDNLCAHSWVEVTSVISCGDLCRAHLVSDPVGGW